MESIRGFKTILALTCGIGAACGGGRTAPLAPVTPAATIQGFMSAVGANNLVQMGGLWGTERGAAIRSMDAVELHKRLSVIRQYLRHDSYLIVGELGSGLLVDERHRIFQVRMIRSGCSLLVPFTLVEVGEGWLIQSIDLAAAGNPAVPCAAGTSG